MFRYFTSSHKKKSRDQSMFYNITLISKKFDSGFKGQINFSQVAESFLKCSGFIIQTFLNIIPIEMAYRPLLIYIFYHSLRFIPPIEMQYQRFGQQMSPFRLCQMLQNTKPFPTHLLQTGSGIQKASVSSGLVTTSGNVYLTLWF